MTGQAASRESQCPKAAPLCGKARKRRSVAIGIAAALFLFAGPAWRAFSAPPQAAEILRKSSAVYSRLQNYHIAVVLKEKFVRSKTTFSHRIRVTLDAAGPGRARMTLDNGDSRLLIVRDGGTLWRYAPATKEYSETVVSAVPTGPDAPEEAGNGNGLLGEMQDLLVGDLSKLSKFTNAVTSTGSAKVQFQGRSVPCYHIVLHWKGLTGQLWIEKSSYLVLRESKTRLLRSGAGFSSSSSSVEITELEVNAARAQDFFTFAPPAGARLVPVLNLPGFRESFVGAVAGDFTLPAVGGGKVSLSDFRGKTVVLSFWATWCGPCREELPTVEKIYREYQGKNVVVLAVDDENPSTVRSFLNEHHYGFTALVDRQRILFRSFAVRYLPTVFVINSKGIIVRHIVGLRSPWELFAAVKAGEGKTGQ